MTSAIRIRLFRPEDADAAARLFFESVRAGAGDQYSEEQRAAWAPEVPSGDDWLGKFTAAEVALVAEDKAGLTGFMTLMADGYLDLAYVRPDCIGRGVAKALYGRIEAEAQQRQVSELTSDASVLARTFFERQGWEVLAEQHPVRGGVEMTNYKMRKLLSE